MIHESVKTIPAPAHPRSRIVIIGGGAVGLFLAKILHDQGAQPIVVESGTRQLGTFGQPSWVSVGREHLGVRFGRSRSLGGTSNLWGGQLAGFRAIDIRPAGPNGIGWPISFQEIAAHYGETYERLGVPVEVHEDAPIWNGVMGAVPNLGPDLQVFLTRWMREPSLARLFGTEIDGPGLHVLLGHAAVGFRGDRGRIDRVLLSDRSGSRSEIEARTFVIAAGTIETSRLLLAAAEDPQFDCPWRTNRNVGCYFQDHLTGRIGVVHPIDKRRLSNLFCTIHWKGRKYQPKFRFSEEYQRAHGLLGVQGIVTFEGSVSEHLTYLKQFLKASLRSRKVTGVADAFKHALASARHLPPLMWTYVRHHRIGMPSGARTILYAQSEQAPLLRSQIRLDRERRDEYGLPRAILDWQVDVDAELTAVREFALKADAALREAGLARVEIDERLLARDSRYVDGMHDTWHQCGGAVVGLTESDGVVDRDLMVFGTSNLYVCGASTFPTNGEANVTFLAMALATRLAKHLAAQASL